MSRIPIALPPVDSVTTRVERAQTALVAAYACSTLAASSDPETNHVFARRELAEAATEAIARAATELYWLTRCSSLESVPAPTDDDREARQRTHRQARSAPARVPAAGGVQ